MCVCVRVCVRACVRACVYMYTLDRDTDARQQQQTKVSSTTGFCSISLRLNAHGLSCFAGGVTLDCTPARPVALRLTAQGLWLFSKQFVASSLSPLLLRHRQSPLSADSKEYNISFRSMPYDDCRLSFQQLDLYGSRVNVTDEQVCGTVYPVVGR